MMYCASLGGEARYSMGQSIGTPNRNAVDRRDCGFRVFMLPPESRPPPRTRLVALFLNPCIFTQSKQ